MRRLLIGVVLFAAAGTTPAAAAETTWDVDFAGTQTYRASYERTDKYSGFKNGAAEARDDVWRTSFGQVKFDSAGRLVGTYGGTTIGRGTGEIHSWNQTNDGMKHIDCEGSSDDPWFGEPDHRGGFATSLSATTEVPASDAPETLVLQPFREFDYKIPCSNDKPDEPEEDKGRWVGRGEFSSLPLGNPYSVLFTMPPEALKLGKVIHVVKSDDTKMRRLCGTWFSTCTWSWEGTITFTRTDYVEPGDAPAPLEPQLPPKPDPFEDVVPLVPPTPAKPKASDPFEDLVPLVPASTATATTKSASVQITCPAACSGTVKAFAASRGARAAGAKPLAVKRFRLAAGRKTRVTLAFRSRARAAVRRAGAVRLVVTTGRTNRAVTARVRAH